jgi:hypothetical protein
LNRLRLTLDEVRERIAPCRPNDLHPTDVACIYRAAWTTLPLIALIFMVHSEDIEVVRGPYPLEEGQGFDFAILDVNVEIGQARDDE